MMDSSSIWSPIWKIKEPPKALNLLWHALSECMLMITQLNQKQVQVDTKCPVCLDGDEMIFNGLVTCPFIVQCWRIIFLDGHVLDDHDLFTWIDHKLSACSHSKPTEIATISWAIWKARNNLV